MSLKVQKFFLKDHILFGLLKEPELESLCDASDYRLYRRDKIIYSYRQLKERVYVVHQGRVKITFQCEKQIEIVPEILLEGDIFGALGLIASDLNNEFAQVMSEDALVSSFPVHALQQALKCNSDAALTYAQLLAGKLALINKKYCDVISTDVRSRVLNFFRLHAQYEGKWVGNQAKIKMFCSHQDIANFIASRRQTVSSVISNLVKEKKIIYEGRSHVIIPDIRLL